MLYQIVETKRGQDRIMMVDKLTECNLRIKQLQSSTKGLNVRFRLEESNQTNKFKAKSRSRGY